MSEMFIQRAYSSPRCVCTLPVTPTEGVTLPLPTPLPTLAHVRAARDIQRGRTTAVQIGSPGRIVNSHPGWADTTYTVEFTAAAGATVTLVGLTAYDIHAG